MHATPASSKTGLAGPHPFLRRLAAIVALIAPIAMAVVAAVALAGDVPIAALAVGLVLVASGAIWFALTDRGRCEAAPWPRSSPLRA